MGNQIGIFVAASGKIKALYDLTTITLIVKSTGRK